MVNKGRIFGRDVFELAGEFVQVCGHGQRFAVGALDQQYVVVGEDLAAGYRAQFLPHLVEGRGRMGANEPAQAAVKNIRSPVPGRA